MVKILKCVPETVDKSICITSYQRRDRLQMIADILRIAKKPCLLRHILRGAKIDWHKACRYLPYLVEIGLLEIVDERLHIYKNSSKQKQRVYQITDKGLHFLNHYKTLIDLIRIEAYLKKSSRQQSRLNKFHAHLHMREQNPWRVYDTDEDIQVCVLTSGFRMVNLEDIYEVSEKKRTINLVLTRQEYKILREKARKWSKGLKDIVHSIVRQHIRENQHKTKLPSSNLQDASDISEKHTISAVNVG